MVGIVRVFESNFAIPILNPNKSNCKTTETSLLKVKSFLRYGPYQVAFLIRMYVLKHAKIIKKDPIETATELEQHRGPWNCQYRF